ncbi:MAG: MmgE/PrpD family protein [Bacillota bacterium]|nr:MmgE/PrpD family protein [Bacillota bacterium]
MDNKTSSEKLADYVYDITYDVLDKRVKEKVSLLFLDWLGSALSGANTNEASILMRALNEQKGFGNSALIGYGKQDNATMAAFINGFTSHIVEYDDTHRDSLYHPGAPTISAALAIAQQIRASGKSFINGLVAGYEVGIRLAASVNPSHYSYWHTTGTIGCFGAAASVASIAELSKEQCVHAFGHAGSMSAGLWEFQNDHAKSKPIHPGRAAQGGIFAVLLAKEGLVGAKSIIDGKQGIFAAMTKEHSLKPIFNRIPNTYVIEETTIKVYPTCGHTHTPIDAALDVHTKISKNINMINRITVKTNSIALKVAGNQNPTTANEAKFSIPFCVAVSLAYGELNTKSFHDSMIFDPVVRQLMNRVDVISTEEFNKVFEICRPTRIEVLMSNDELITSEIKYRRGDPENPVGKDFIKNKFLELNISNYPLGFLEEIFEFCRSLDQINDMRELNNILAAK